MSGLKMFGLRLNIWSEAAWPGLQFLVSLLSLGWHVRSEFECLAWGCDCPV